MTRKAACVIFFIFSFSFQQTLHCGPFGGFLSCVWGTIRHPVEHLKKREIMASSPFVANRIVSYIAVPKSGEFKICEIGAGDGPISVQMANKITQSGNQACIFDLVEIDHALCEKLRTHLSRYPFCSVHEHDFSTWSPPADQEGGEETRTYDAIICTLPFIPLPNEVVLLCLDNISRILKPGGTFIYVSLLGARSLNFLYHLIINCFNPMAYKKFMDKINTFDLWIYKNFDEITTSFLFLDFPPIVLRNLPPMWVHVGYKREAPKYVTRTDEFLPPPKSRTLKKND
jgi:phospholipid N-methyltransferase